MRVLARLRVCVLAVAGALVIGWGLPLPVTPTPGPPCDGISLPNGGYIGWPDSAPQCSDV